MLSQYLWLTTYILVILFPEDVHLNQRWKSLALDSFSRNFLCSTLYWHCYSRCSRDLEFPKFRKVLGLSNFFMQKSLNASITYNIDKNDNEDQLCCLKLGCEDDNYLASFLPSLFWLSLSFDLGCQIVSWIEILELVFQKNKALVK